MTPCQVTDQIGMADSISELDQLAKTIWQHFGEGQIKDEDAEDLNNKIRIRRVSINAQRSKITFKPGASIEERNTINTALSHSKKSFSRKKFAEAFCTQTTPGQNSKKDDTYQDHSSKYPAYFVPIPFKYNADNQKSHLSASLSAVSKKVKPQAKRGLKPNKETGSLGLDWPEIKKLSTAAHCIQSMPDAGILCMATISNKLVPEREIRKAARKFKNYLVKYQSDVNTRSNWLEVWESKESIHAHILFRIKGRRGFDLVARLAQSESFPENILNVKKWSNGDDFVIYCGKEHTTWVGKIFREKNILYHKRVSSSRISGDRVRICPSIKTDLIASKKLLPTKGINASRNIPSVIPKPLEADREISINSDLWHSSDLFGGTLKAAERPQISIPNDKATAKRRPKLIRDDELPLVLLPDARDLIKLVGSSDRERAEKLGVSRAQVTNIKNGQFGSSKGVVKKVLELVKLAA